jgi:hypothetical protein
MVSRSKKRRATIDVLEDLFNNPEEYHRTGNSMRSYTQHHFTYKAFVDQVLSVLRRKGAID